MLKPESTFFVLVCCTATLRVNRGAFRIVTAFDRAVGVELLLIGLLLYCAVNQ